MKMKKETNAEMVKRKAKDLVDTVKSLRKKPAMTMKPGYKAEVVKRKKGY